jgi:hypothetical protein
VFVGDGLYVVKAKNPQLAEVGTPLRARCLPELTGVSLGERDRDDVRRGRNFAPNPTARRIEVVEEENAA